MRVLITGISGQDGYYLQHQLRSAGHEVLGTSRRSCGDILELDYGSEFDATSLIRATKPDVIFNLAGLSSLADSEVDRALTWRVNYAAPLALFRAAIDQNTNVRIVQASSALVFGQQAEGALSEASPRSPDTFYAEAKAALDDELSDMRADGLHASSAILFNHDSPQRGEGFVSKKIVDGLVRVQRFGGPAISLRALDDRRDWSHASDVASAMMLMANSSDPDSFVVASGELHSVWDWVWTAGRLLGFHPSRQPDGRVVCSLSGKTLIEPSSPPASQSPERLGNPGLLETSLHWKRRFSFEELVQDMVDASRSVTSE